MSGLWTLILYFLSVIHLDSAFSAIIVYLSCALCVAERFKSLLPRNGCLDV